MVERSMSWLRRAVSGLVVTVTVAWAAGCGDSPSGPEGDLSGGELPQGVLLSNPVSRTSLPTSVLAPVAGERSSAAGDSVAFISLGVGTVPSGARARIQRLDTTTSVTTTVVNGGFDAVPIPARTGDSIEVVVFSPGGATLLAVRAPVRPSRPPVVVRTVPPQDKTDVPVNASIVIVFSEPVAGASLTAASVQLFRDATPVTGTPTVLQGSGNLVAFTPDAPLVANAQYRVVVTPAVQDLDGEALQSAATASFTTGASTAGPPASITVLPDTIRVRVNSTYQLTATVRDAAGTVLIDQPITWSSSDATNLPVSAAGLVTANTTGMFSVLATVNGLTARAIVLVNPGPPASLTLTPAADTLAAGDTIRLSATVRDADGFVVNCPTVTWASSSPAVATVTADSCTPEGVGKVAGVSAGTATITATSGAAVGTASITVLPPRPLPRYVAVTAGFEHTCGLTLEGDAYCWGRNAGTVPRYVGLPTFTGLSANSGNFTCGVTAAREAYCWGWNSRGSLGTGDTIRSDSPRMVAGGLAWASVAAGAYEHACGLTTANVVYCWGQNYYGQVGDGSMGNVRLSPVAVVNAPAFTQVTAGGEHSCGLTAAGAAYCWGHNDKGQLGDSTTTNRLTPTRVVGAQLFASIDASWYHTCGVTTAGTAYCWGFNTYGSVGDATTSQRLVPTAVSGGLSFGRVEAGYAQSCGVTTTNVAYCWGRNAEGQLGVGSTTGPETCVIPGPLNVPCSTVPRRVAGQP